MRETRCGVAYFKGDYDLLFGELARRPAGSDKGIITGHVNISEPTVARTRIADITRSPYGYG